MTSARNRTPFDQHHLPPCWAGGMVGGSPTAEPGADSGVFLKRGGTRSGGNFTGSGCPCLEISTKCMASTNSSHDNLPSLSRSDRLLWIKDRENEDTDNQNRTNSFGGKACDVTIYTKRTGSSLDILPLTRFDRLMLWGNNKSQYGSFFKKHFLNIIYYIP